MGMRCSFSLDPEMMEEIDQFAKGKSMDRNEAILALIESGFAHFGGGGTYEVKQKRTFEEIDQIIRDLGELKRVVGEIRDEMRLIHHTVETEWNREADTVPFQTKRFWEFRK